MDEAQALNAFSALSQETRLRIVRLLVIAGPEGMAAGAIGKELRVASSRLSFHLSHLEHAGLIQSQREGRSIRYTASYAALSSLIAFLMRDCCQGRPEVCAATMSALSACDCLPPAPLKIPTKERAMQVTIYHNPACGTSRNVLAMIQNSGEEPLVIEYLKTPPSRAELSDLIQRMGVPVRSVLREKGTPYHELGLDNPDLTDDALLDAMMAHPILINRPIVVTDLGVRLCRPSETVLEILPNPQRGTFTKEDGEAVIDAAGQRVDKPGHE
jgi:arsenate reductase